MNRIRSAFLLMLFLLLWNSPVSAVDYYWLGSATGTTEYSDAQSACNAVSVSATGYPTAQLERVSDTYFYCKLWNEAQQKYVSYGSSYNARRFGDSCPVDSSYDPSTGQCLFPEPDQCATATGEFVHEYNAGSLDPSVPPSLPPTSICESGCLYNRTATVKGCNRFLEDTTGKDLNSVYCKVVYKGAASQLHLERPASRQRLRPAAVQASSRQHAAVHQREQMRRVGNES